jgi:DNA-binding IclR family transcriptional regulator
MPAERDTSIRRGMDVLGCLSGDEALQAGGLGVTRISELIGKEKSQVSRSLKILAEYGMVDRDPKTLAYRLGWRIFSMAQLAGDRRLLDKAQVQLTRLVEELGESVYLSVLNGRDALTLLARSPNTGVQATAWAGRTFPAYSSSVGRVLLSRRSAKEIQALFAGVPLTTKNADVPLGVDELLVRLTTAREQGYAIVDQEFEPGVIAVAAPITDPRGAVIAALNASGPSYRFTAQIERATAIVVQAAAQLSAALAGPDQNSPAEGRPDPDENP